MATFDAILKLTKDPTISSDVKIKIADAVKVDLKAYGEEIMNGHKARLSDTSQEYDLSAEDIQIQKLEEELQSQRDWQETMNRLAEEANIRNKK